MAENAAKPFLAVLVTRGRRTGREHSVTLRAVLHESRYYFSRRRPDGDWFRNAMRGGQVRIILDGRAVAGTARVVTDPDLVRRISELKYPGEARVGEPRVAIQVTPDE